MSVLIAGISRIELNDEWLRYFDESYDIRTASDFSTENLTGFDVIEYSLNSGEAGGINNPEYLKKLEEFAAWYRKQPNVVHINSITTIIKRLNKNMHRDDETYYRIPEDRELAAQYLLLYEMSLPFGLDLNNQINVDKSATRFIVSFKSMSAKVTREMDMKAREWLKENAPEEMFTYGSGLTVIWAHISQRNIDSMLRASFLALVLISGLMIFALRSLKLGLLSLVPNLTPALMAFGVWGMTVGQIGLGLSVVVAMTLGIVVDDTVHFMSKYIRARRENNTDSADAVRYSFHTVGNAMMITTASLVGGFLVLTWSGYSMNSDMGLLSAITITIALLMDFFFLPVLLMKTDGKTDELILEEDNDDILSAAD
jgi:predicted RND superfamily exporter protein